MKQTIRQNLLTIQEPPKDPHGRAAYAATLIRRARETGEGLRRYEATLAVYLKQIRDGELWRGYAESWPAYLADPEIGPGVSRSTAYRLIGNWEAAQPWIENGTIALGEFARLQSSKFELVAPAMRVADSPEQVRELVAQVQSNGKTDLRKAMRQSPDPETRAAVEYAEHMERTHYRLVVTAGKLKDAAADHAGALRHEIEIATETLEWLERRAT